MYVLDFPLSRLSYAAHTEDAVDVSRAGLAAWVGRQLDPKIRGDAGLDGRLRAFKLHIKYAAGNGEPTPNGDTRNWPAMDEMRPLTYLDAPIERPWAFLESKAAHPQEELARPYQEVVAATVFRAAHSRAQLYEQMVGFWHDHFNVLASDDKRIGCALPSYDRDAIRPHALGNFRDLLEAVAKSPAMLIYLSNASSRAGAANENYARELMELHTLGRDAYLNDKYDRWRDVPGASDGAPQGYIDEDVYEAARAFTGWTVENGQRLDGSTELPRTGKFTYIEGWHDGYQKRVLATEFEPFARADVGWPQGAGPCRVPSRNRALSVLQTVPPFRERRPSAKSRRQRRQGLDGEREEAGPDCACHQAHRLVGGVCGLARHEAEIAARACGKLRPRHGHRVDAGATALPPACALRPTPFRLALSRWASGERGLLSYARAPSRALGAGHEARHECVEYRPAEGARAQ